MGKSSYDEGQDVFAETVLRKAALCFSSQECPTLHCVPEKWESVLEKSLEEQNCCEKKRKHSDHDNSKKKMLQLSCTYVNPGLPSPSHHREYRPGTLSHLSGPQWKRATLQDKLSLLKISPYCSPSQTSSYEFFCQNIIVC